MLRSIPSLETPSVALHRAFRVALGDIVSNIVPFAGGRHTTPVPCLAAGLDYPTPWTRDISVNTWNGVGLLAPEVCRNGLDVVLERDGDGWRVGGQYWDAIVWAQGAWQLYLYEGDRERLRFAHEVVERSIAFFERTEFDAAVGLFRGPAFFQDGIAGYPDHCAGSFGSDVRDWVRENGSRRSPVGFGIPWFALSTNCLHARAYQLAAAMRAELGLAPEPSLAARHAALRDSIHHRFRLGEGRWAYLLTPEGRCDHQEGAGLAFLMLFDLVSADEAAAILRHATVLPAGLPCVWPTFPRYAAFGAGHYGRHAGTVWPHVQAFFADAARRHGRLDRFAHELEQLARRAARDGQFSEIYHPITGAIYGGVQEDHLDSHLRLWDSVPRTPWGATGFLRLVISALVGLDFTPAGIRFAPCLPAGLGPLVLRGLRYRDAVLTIEVSGHGSLLAACRIDGAPMSEPFLPAATRGEVHVSLELAPA